MARSRRGGRGLMRSAAVQPTAWVDSTLRGRGWRQWDRGECGASGAFSVGGACCEQKKACTGEGRTRCPLTRPPNLVGAKGVVRGRAEACWRWVHRQAGAGRGVS